MMRFDLTQKNSSFRANDILHLLYREKIEIFSIDRRVLDSAQRTARRHSMISALKNKGNYRGNTVTVMLVTSLCW